MEEYMGFKEVILPNDIGDVESFINDKARNYDCLQNEYLIVKDENGNEVAEFKFDGENFVKIPYRQINNAFMGKIKPRNVQQRLAIDMLYDPSTTVNIISGKAGSGKDFIASAVAIDLLSKECFEKIVYVRNNIEVRNTRPIGYLPGESDDKLLPFAMPLADNIGGIDMLKTMMARGKIEVQHLGFIRGRGPKNSIIICDEAENMTKDLSQLLISRVGEGSVIWIIGDNHQVDADIYKRDNGLNLMIERFKGHPRFGYVKFLKTERSETARMADLLD